MSNIHHPTLTVYLPARDKATGAAVIVAPGGGHRNLAIQHEGYNVAQWLADHGIAAFILKSQKIIPTKDSPPAFLACGYNDRPDISEGLAKVYLLFKQAGVQAELHIYAGTGHGFGVRDTNKTPAGAWPERFREWLADRKFVRSTAP